MMRWGDNFELYMIYKRVKKTHLSTELGHGKKVGDLVGSNEHIQRKKFWFAQVCYETFF